MKKEIGVLLGMAFALTSCEMEQRNEHKIEERDVRNAQETPVTPVLPSQRTNGLEKAPDAPKPSNPLQKR